MPSRSLTQSFGRVLRSHRKSAGLSQEALADKAGLHRTYIGLIERDLRNPTIIAAHQLAQVLGVRLSELVAEAEEMSGS